MPSETTTACVRLLAFFRIRHGTFPYGVEDDASTISQTPTTHYTNTCVKLTIVTHLSFSERIAIANLSYENSHINTKNRARNCLIMFSCSADHEQDDNLTRLILTLARCNNHIYTREYNKKAVGRSWNLQRIRPENARQHEGS